MIEKWGDPNKLVKSIKRVIPSMEGVMTMVVRKDKRKRTWIVDMTVGVNTITGKRKRVVRTGFPTKAEAEKKENKLYQELYSNTPSYENIRIKELFDTLIKEDLNKQRKPSYIQTQKHNFNRHIKGYFKNCIIVNLNYEHIYDYREHLCEKNISNNTVNKIMILFKRILDVAIRKGHMTDNPCCLLKKLPIVKKRMDFWTLEEFKKFKNLFFDNELNYLIFFTLAFFTGMRSGELLGLCWEDIDFYRREINVNKTLVKVDGNFLLNSPKTVAGKRRISINSKLIADLEEWKTIQYEWLTKETFFKIEDQEKLQVVQKNHQLLHKDNVRKKYEVIFKRQDTLKKIRIHDFRHSHVALLIHYGEDPYMIKERIGHASIQTIYDLYGHLYPSKQIDTANRLDALY